MPHKRKLEKDIRCPLEYGLDVFGGRWKSRIICVLGTKGTLRYSNLRDEMTNVSDAVLSSSLKELIADGIVARRSYDEIPPRVEYSLTEKGASVVPVLQEICRWAGMFHREVTDDTPKQCQMCDYGGFSFGDREEVPTEEEFVAEMGRRYERMLDGQESEHDLVEPDGAK